MKFNQKNWDKYVAHELNELAGLPGVRVTRRHAIRVTGIGALATALGCGAEAETRAGADAASLDNARHGSTDEPGTNPNNVDMRGDPSNKEPSMGRGGEQRGRSGTDGKETEPETKDPTDPGQPSDPVPEPEPQVLTLDQLVEIVHPEAKKLVESASGDEIAYLEMVAALVPKVVVDLPDLKTPKWNLKKLKELPPIEVVEIEIAPGHSIPLHDHRDYNGVLCGVDGEAHCVNYSAYAGDAPEGMFLLQKTYEDTLTAGKSAYLGLELHNFHVISAGKTTTRLLDVFTFWPGGAATSAWAKINPKPVNEKDQVYMGWWL